MQVLATPPLPAVMQPERHSILCCGNSYRPVMQHVSDLLSVLLLLHRTVLGLAPKKAQRFVRRSPASIGSQTATDTSFDLPTLAFVIRMPAMI